MILIKQKRLQNGMTQREFGAMIGATGSAVAMWETGKRFPRADKLPEIAKVLGCTIDDLYRDTGQKGA